jgi:hypothetical protein
LALIDGAVDSHAESDAEARIFVAADARMLLGPLSVPSAVEWGTMDAVCRWVASIADNGASLAVAPISWLLATPPPSQSRLSTVLLRGRLLADKVRGAIVSVPCRCCRRQPPSTVPGPFFIPPPLSSPSALFHLFRAFFTSSFPINCRAAQSARFLLRPARVMCFFSQK